MSYAIIALGGKQYRVQEGERLLVDRVRADEGATLTPTVLFVGGDDASDTDSTVVTARVVEHVLGEKVRIGKYKPKKGYRRHAGFRARLSRIEIDAIGGKRQTTRAKAEKPADAQEATAAVAEAPSQLPAGYADMTVAQIGAEAAAWDVEALRAALAYERHHAARKGAISALESAIAAKEND